jgi:Family of unknown function (DUF6717)
VHVPEVDRGRGVAARQSRLMHTLTLRWELDTWVYDDPELGVYAEPFVLGADTMLTRLRAVQIAPGHDPFRIVFSSSAFPGAIEAKRLDEEDGGVWYEAALGQDTMRGWLCSHFFDYFRTAPASVYVKAEPIT